jgi:hypothetical protein
MTTIALTVSRAQHHALIRAGFGALAFWRAAIVIAKPQGRRGMHLAAITNASKARPIAAGLSHGYATAAVDL